MARELRRLLITPQRLAQARPLLALEAGEVHYLRRVLRLRPGDRLELVDGVGGLWSALVEPEQAAGGAGSGGAAAVLRLEQEPEAPLRREPPEAWPLLLALAVPRRDAEVVWRMATELGADGLQPLRAERSSLAGTPPLERWGTIVAEAAEQCERLWLPALAPLEPALPWLVGSGCQAGVGPPDKGGKQRMLLATTRRGDLPSLEQALADLGDPGPAGVSLAIGPEGGWSPREEAEAEAAGWRAVGLGPTILRSSTAAVAAVARLVAWRTARLL